MASKIPVIALSSEELAALYQESGSLAGAADLLATRHGIRVTGAAFRKAMVRADVPRIEKHETRRKRTPQPPPSFPCSECGEPFAPTYSQWKLARHRADKSGRGIRLFCSRKCVYTFTSRENSGKTPDSIDIEPIYRRPKPEDPRDTVYLVTTDGGKKLINGPLEPEED